MRILYLIPSPGPDATAAQVAQLAAALPRDRFEARVAALSSVTSGAASAVPCLNWTRLLDPRPLWILRRLVRDFRPDAIHVWEVPALRALALAGRPAGCAVVVSRPLAAGRCRLPRLDRWMLGRADRVAVSGTAEADRCLAAGIPVGKLVVVPPAVAASAGGSVGAAGSLLCAGRMLPHKGYRDAIWTADILRYLHDDVRLVLAGDGPERARLQRFTARIRAEAHVHFAGLRQDVAALMSAAAAVWVPSLADGGVQAALEAMAAGRPVVASRLPGLAEVVAEGETGLLVPPGDKIALARQTDRLLRDEELRRRLGEAGQARARRCFTPQAAADVAAAVYRDLAA